MSKPISPTNCPRSFVVAKLYDPGGHLLTVGRNHLPDDLSPCKCDGDNPDTNARGSTTCMAIHAEVDALLKWGKHPNMPKPESLVTTRAPCRECIKILLHTSVRQILVKKNPYPDRDNSQEVWESTGRLWTNLHF